MMTEITSNPKNRTEPERRKALFRHYFIKYFRYYNKNNVRAQSDFVRILSRLKKRYNSKDKEFENLKAQFKEKANDYYNQAREYEHDITIDTLKADLFDILETLFIPEDLLFPYVNSIIDNLLNETSVILTLVKGANPEDSELPIYRQIHQLHDIYKEMVDIRIHKAAIIYMSKMAFDQKSPDSLELPENFDYEEVVKVLVEEKNEQFHIEAEPKKGRPADFDISDTERWYKELSKDPDYQKSGGTPNVGKITREIIKRHYSKTGFEPSVETIRRHRRKLDLTLN